MLSAWIAIHESTWCASGGPALAPVCDGDAAFGSFAACAAPPSAKPTISAPPPLTNDLRENSLLEDLGHGYFPPFAITAAAFWIAVRIRG